MWQRVVLGWFKVGLGFVEVLFRGWPFNFAFRGGFGVGFGLVGGGLGPMPKEGTSADPAGAAEEPPNAPAAQFKEALPLLHSEQVEKAPDNLRKASSLILTRRGWGLVNGALFWVCLESWRLFWFSGFLGGLNF